MVPSILENPKPTIKTTTLRKAYRNPMRNPPPEPSRNSMENHLHPMANRELRGHCSSPETNLFLPYF